MNLVDPLRRAVTVLGAVCWGTALAAAAVVTSQGEGRVDIVAWNGYVERGASDRRYDWVTPFEESTGCRVHVRVAASSDEMIALMRRGQADLVTATGHASLRLVFQRLVRPLELSRVPGYFRLVDPRLQRSPLHYVNGKHYGVPYLWGPEGLLYDTRVFRTPPTDARALYEPMTLPDGKPNAGRIQAEDSPAAIGDAAAYLMSRRPELGIREPYELNEPQYAAAIAALRVQQRLLHSRWDDEATEVEDFRAGRIVLAQTWAYPALVLKRTGAPVGFAVPKQGATGWADATMMHVTAAHPDCAYAWLEWSIQPRTQGDAAAFTGAVPSVPAACTASPLLGPNGCAERGSATFDRIHFTRTPTTRCVTHGRCVGYARWQRDYAAIVTERRPP